VAWSRTKHRKNICVRAAVTKSTPATRWKLKTTHGPTSTTPGELTARSRSLCAHMCLPCPLQYWGVRARPDQQRGRACAVFYFLLVAVDRVTAARTNVFLRYFVSNYASATPSCRHYRLAVVTVTSQVMPSALHYSRQLLREY
jgi:hypothetical protein